MAETIQGKAGRQYKTIAPNTKCLVCGKTAGKLGCATLMAFRLHEGYHVRRGEAKWKGKGHHKVIVPNTVAEEVTPSEEQLATTDGFDDVLKSLQNGLTLIKLSKLLLSMPATQAEALLEMGAQMGLGTEKRK